MSKTSTERESLSRSVVARAALEMTDEHGLAGLSMRKLGAVFGVEAMSLYHYVENKNDLLDAIVEELYLKIELPRDVPEHDWETAVRLGLRAFHDVLIRHPAALELMSNRPAPSVEAYQVLTWGVSRFVMCGLDLEESAKALHLGISFVLGFTSTEAGVLVAIRSGKGLDPELMTVEQGAESMRLISEMESESVFKAGLDAIIAGLRALYDLP